MEKSFAEASVLSNPPSPSPIPQSTQSSTSLNKKKSHGSWTHAIAGAGAGTVTSLLCQPLDVVKTRMIGIPSNQQKSILNTFRIIAQQDGIRGLWQGTIPTFWRVLPGAAIYFGMIHRLKSASESQFFNETFTLSDHSKNFLIGSIARTIAGTITCPILVVKTRFEFASKDSQLRKSSIVSTLSHIYRTEGINGLFRGLTPSIVRDVPYAGLFFVFYSYFKDIMMHISILESIHHGNEHVPYITLPCGAVAGGFATLATHPFDVARTRMQLNPSRSGVIQTMMLVIQHDGLTSLCRGLVPRVAKRSLSSAMSWALYEGIVGRLITEEHV